MGGTQLHGQLQPRGHHVDGDDGGGTGDLGRHHRAQADRTGAIAGEAAARSHLQRVEHRPRTSLDAAAQRAEQLQRRIVRHLDRVDLARQRKRGERRLCKEVIVQRLALCIGDGGMAVAIISTEVQREEIAAVRAMSTTTGIAVAALAVGQHHVVAGLQFTHVGADRLDDPRALMAQHRRQRHRIVLVTHDQVGMAQAGRHDLHQYLIVLRATQTRLLDDKRLFLAAYHGGGDVTRSTVAAHRCVLLDQMG
ncbi:hypothetical protein D3C73_988990 [compost metagenome]